LIYRKLLLVLFAVIYCLPVVTHAQGMEKPSQAVYLEGLRLYNEGFFEESSKSFEMYIESDTDVEHRELATYFLSRARAATKPARKVLFYEQFVTAYPKSERSADLLIELGHTYRESGDNLLSIDFFERALEINMAPAKGAEALYWTAEMYIAINDYDTAREYYLKLADTYPRSDWAPKALYARGRLFLEELDFAETSTAFELLRNRYPFSPVTRRIGTALGESYFQQGKYREAALALRNAIPSLDDKEQESKAVYLIAESYNYLNELDDASTWYLRFVNQNKGNENERLAHYGLGWVYHKQGIYHWAAQSFGRAYLGDDDFSRKALYYKAVNEKLSGRYDLALGTFHKFGQEFKEGFWIEEAYYEWAMVSFEVGDYVTALETLLDLIRSQTRLKNPGDVYTLLGEAYFANNEYSRAIDAFEAAEQITGLDPAIKRQARFQRGWVMFQNQVFDAAQPIFEQVYTEDPSGRLAGEALFWSADSWYNMERYERAATQFELFLRNFPNHEFAGAAQYSLGWSYFRMGNYEKAIEPLRKFLEEYEAPPIALFPYDIDTKLRLGDSYYAMRQYREALRYYEQAIGLNPGGDYALYQVANSYYRADQTYEAVQAFRRLLRQFPDSRLREQTMYNIGYIYFLAGNFSQAIEEFERLIRLYRGSNWAARAQYNIGDAHYNAGEYEKAAAAYQLVLDNYPRSPLIIEAVNGIQYAMLAAGNEDASSDALEAFIRQNPQAGTADMLRFRQAEFLLRTADYAAAIEAFRDYLRITNSTRNVPEAWYNLADAYRQLNDMDAAINAYQTLINDHGNSGRAESAMLNLGSIYYSKNDYQKSLEFYNQLLRRTTRLRNEAGIGVGNNYLALDRLGEAEAAYRQVLQNNPNNDAADLGLAKVLIRQGQISTAMPILEEISERNTLETGAEAQYWIGFAHQRNNDYDKALEAFARVRVLYEAYEYWVSMSLVRSAEVFRARGDQGEARATYQSIVDNFPGTEAAEIARRVLQGN
jgi:tetratricopeptide (TPR) repeat protein